MERGNFIYEAFPYDSPQKLIEIFEHSIQSELPKEPQFKYHQVVLIVGTSNTPYMAGQIADFDGKEYTVQLTKDRSEKYPPAQLENVPQLSFIQVRDQENPIVLERQPNALILSIPFGEKEYVCA